MDENEFRSCLTKFSLDERKLCAFIYNETGAIVNHRHIRGYFERGQCLSEPMTGLLRFAFKRLGQGVTP